MSCSLAATYLIGILLTIKLNRSIAKGRGLCIQQCLEYQMAKWVVMIRIVKIVVSYSHRILSIETKHNMKKHLKLFSETA